MTNEDVRARLFGLVADVLATLNLANFDKLSATRAVVTMLRGSEAMRDEVRALVRASADAGTWTDIKDF